MLWAALGPLGVSVYHIQHCVSESGFPTHKHQKEDTPKRETFYIRQSIQLANQEPSFWAEGVGFQWKEALIKVFTGVNGTWSCSL
jgi:hypothetical protein